MKSLAAFAALLLSLAVPSLAVLRPPALDSPPDTLELLPHEARDFRIRLHAGSDLHQAGFALGLFAVPAVLLAPWAADQAGLESPVGDFQDAFFLLTFAVLPAFSTVMASGNLVYAGAARYHPDREFAIVKSLLPVLAIALTAGKVFYLAANPDLGEATGRTRGLAVAFALTEVLTIPALHSQFSAASAFLEQVDIRVTGRGPAVSYRLEF
jgi:hypothetical protein